MTDTCDTVTQGKIYPQCNKIVLSKVADTVIIKLKVISGGIFAFKTMMYTYRQCIVQPPLLRVQLGQQGAPLVRQLGNLIA